MAEMLNMYSASQSVIDDSNKPLPIPEPVQHTLESISITTQDVLDVGSAFKPEITACNRMSVKHSLSPSQSLSLSLSLSLSHLYTYIFCSFQ